MVGGIICGVKWTSARPSNGVVVCVLRDWRRWRRDGRSEMYKDVVGVS